MRCMDCGRAFEGDPGPPPHRRCDPCTAAVVAALKRLPPEKQDQLIHEALQRAANALRKEPEP